MLKSISIVLVFFLTSFNEMSSQNEKNCITRVTNSDNSVDFKYIKSESGNFFVEFTLENVSNVKDISSFKKTYNVNLQSNSGTLFKLYPIDKDKPIYCSYTYSFTRGLIKPEVDNSVVYLLPFMENKNVTIYESFKFNVSPHIWKNYVVYSKTKDTICAMRKGIVTEIKKIAIADKGNIVFKVEVIVDHADGTNASYTGLDEKSLAVKVNDLVYPGSRIGVMDDIFDNDKYRNFKFNIYYFSNEEIDGVDGKKLKIIEKSVMPIFFTAEGYQNLVSDKKYTVKHNNEILFKEMTSEEKERFGSQIRS